MEFTVEENIKSEVPRQAGEPMLALVRVPLKLTVHGSVESFNKFAESFGEEPMDRECKGAVASSLLPKSKELAVLLLDQGDRLLNHRVCVHETWHAVSAIGEYLGVQSTGDEEVAAYMFETVYAEIVRQAVALGHVL